MIGTHVPDGSSGQSQGRENCRVVATIGIVLLVGACSGGGRVETTVAPEAWVHSSDQANAQRVVATLDRGDVIVTNWGLD